MGERKFQPGFRLSALDVVVLFVGGVACAYAFAVDRWFGAAVGFVLVHFFLFCNVLRMSRTLELVWAGVFLGLIVVGMIYLGGPPWPGVFTISAVMTVIVTMCEARRPSYHGVGWQKLNPRLPEWWHSARAGL